MLTGKRPTMNFGYEPNRLSKKRGAKEVEEIDLTTTTWKKQKLDRDLFLSTQCLNVLKSLTQHRFECRFDDLVVKKPMDFSVISKPMDFVTIKSKLDMNLYKNTEAEFPEDVRLVFANATRYYHPESSVHKNAKELMKIFEIRWESVKNKLACEFSDRLKQKLPEKTEASTSKCFYLTEKVSLQTNPVKSDKVSKGYVLPMPLYPNRALRDATIRIRFADTIMKAKYKKLIEESGSNKADVMKKIEKEKKNLETRQSKEIARIEAGNKAPALKLRHKARLVIEKVEEEAKSNVEEDHLVTEKKIVNLCGGSYLARTRWLERFGLFLKRDEDYEVCLQETQTKACDDREEGEII